MKARLPNARLLPVLLALAVVLLYGSLASACPTCANGMAGDDPHRQAMVEGYFYSILLMMAMPFLLIGGFSLYMYLEIRKARAKQLADLAEQSALVEDEPVEAGV
ncbi:MAG: hypothetical protein KDA42_12820 [Planctomycetales bacterium]|nr:hypothetical protein [Planctomycetales bacterium]